MTHKEKVFCMEAQRWSRIVVRGITPYTIDKVEGTACNEWDRRGRSLPVSEWNQHRVTAFDLRHPDGRSERFAYLRDAKAKARELLEARKQ